MIDEEAKFWMERRDSKTVDSIQSYNSNLLMLQEMARVNNAKGFFYVFQRRQVFIDGIRECFRVSVPVKETASVRAKEKLRISKRRCLAEQLFEQVCSELLSIMELESIIENAAGWGDEVTLDKSKDLVKAQKAQAKAAIKAEKEAIKAEEEEEKQAGGAGGSGGGSGGAGAGAGAGGVKAGEQKVAKK